MSTSSPKGSWAKTFSACKRKLKLYLFRKYIEISILPLKNILFLSWVGPFQLRSLIQTTHAHSNNEASTPISHFSQYRNGCISYEYQIEIQSSHSTLKVCNANTSCPTGEIWYNSKTQSSAESVCIGTTCSKTSICPASQYCGRRLIGNPGLNGADPRVYSGIQRCLDISLACGEDSVFPGCGCPVGMEYIEGDWNRSGTPSETTMSYHFCAPKGTN